MWFPVRQLLGFLFRHRFTSSVTGAQLARVRFFGDGVLLLKGVDPILRGSYRAFFQQGAQADLLRRTRRNPPTDLESWEGDPAGRESI